MYPRINLEALDAESAAAAAVADLGAANCSAADGAFFASVPKTTTIYILRHGQSVGNAAMTFQGRLDYPLDEKGNSQAAIVAAWFKDKSVDAVVASPLSRAATTAATIVQACGLEVQSCDALAEVDVGLFSGMSVDQACAQYPEIYGRFTYTSWDAVPGAEHSSRMYYRAMRSWARMRTLAEQGARSIVCVSHGGLIQFLIRSTFGARTWLPLFPTGNCGISAFEIEPTQAGKPAFVQWKTLNFQVPVP
ncbi:MAG: putative phosphoglycerate mutase [Spirochaetes bacterium]|nr:MAG: putative phosphoglycerate mutase [Spirochaetota bacterium]